MIPKRFVANYVCSICMKITKMKIEIVDICLLQSAGMHTFKWQHMQHLKNLTHYLDLTILEFVTRGARNVS